MPLDSLDQLLDELDEARRAFGADDGARVESLLAQLRAREFRDAESLIRLHEALLFICAYPQGRAARRLAESLLDSFAARVQRLVALGIDPLTFDYIEYSGMAGTTLRGRYSYGFARWLVAEHGAGVEIDWAQSENKERLGTGLPRLVPLLEEDALVEANVPYREWIGAARGRKPNDLAWLIDSFERSSLTEKEKSARYDGLELWIGWELGEAKHSRTKNRRAPRKIYYHNAPLIRRNEVRLETEIRAPLTITKLSFADGKAALNMCRETTAVRYRELYGIAYGDPASVVQASFARGVEIFLWELPPERRLPLRAYHAGFTLKNGVPINYIEGISLAERMELGFNTFYTYREGETAWVYAQALRFLHQLTGATCFSIDPYQIGFHNDEALESGAFWFYRKLGFRPTRPHLIKLVEAEEKKIAASRDYRTSMRTLRRLAEAPVIYERPGTRVGDWDQFQVRNLGLAVARRMADEFAGDADKFRAVAAVEVAQALDLQIEKLKAPEREAFAHLALVLALISDLAAWPLQEKQAVAQIIRAKAGREEWRYARRLQRHKRLREWLIKLGTN